MDLDKLEALAKAATPGPWTLCHHLKSVEHDKGCTCGYRGLIYGPDDVVPMAICQPGHDAEPEGQEGLGPQRYERETEIANAGWIAAANPKTILALIADVRALRDRDIKLFYELEGVVIDTERGHGFDEVCLNTVKRVRDALGGAK